MPKEIKALRDRAQRVIEEMERLARRAADLTMKTGAVLGERGDAPDDRKSHKRAK
jgi:hypothetical protein